MLQNHTDLATSGRSKPFADSNREKITTALDRLKTLQTDGSTNGSHDFKNSQLEVAKSHLQRSKKDGRVAEAYHGAFQKQGCAPCQHAKQKCCSPVQQSVTKSVCDYRLHLAQNWLVLHQTLCITAKGCRPNSLLAAQVEKVTVNSRLITAKQTESGPA